MNGSSPVLKKIWTMRRHLDDATKRHFDYLENLKKTLTTAPQYSHGKPAAVKYDNFSELTILYDRISSSRQAALQALGRLSSSVCLPDVASILPSPASKAGWEEQSLQEYRAISIEIY